MSGKQRSPFGPNMPTASLFSGGLNFLNEQIENNVFLKRTEQTSTYNVLLATSSFSRAYSVWR